MLETRYRVRVSASALMRTGYLAGDDDTRAAELNACLRDPDVRAIVIARGGYGLMRILPRLDMDALRRDPKLIVGFSDATALLCWALGCAGVRCVHGPMAAQLADLPRDDVAWLFDLMERAKPAGRWPAALARLGGADESRSPEQPPEVIEGVLVGGNLCLLSHLAGTPYGLCQPRAVLAFEDVGERPYRIDRYLTQLGLAGVFEHTVAAIVGEFADCDETLHTDHPGALDVVEERLQRYAIPAVKGAPMAHGARNLAFPVGVRCALDRARGALYLREAAVA